MKKQISLFVLIFGLISIVNISCIDDNLVMVDDDEIQVLDLSNGTSQTLSKAKYSRRNIEIVKLQGWVNNFGWDLLQNPPQPKPLVGVPDVKIWVAEYPFTKMLDIKTDINGQWNVYVIKRSNMIFKLSFVYEKDYYPANIENLIYEGGLPEEWNSVTIKSNIHTIGSEDIMDLAMQMPDELYLFYAKTQLENGISGLIGVPYKIDNLLVATVGKSWASIYDKNLPHGDPGAQVILNPTPQLPIQGPIYFDETVTPNPTITSTSVDGGALYNNLQPGKYSMTAQKEPYDYDEVEFIIDPSINIYVSSPPHSIQGTNSSGPGEE